jgi:isopenicillin-N N-acyltransferase like protein
VRDVVNQPYPLVAVAGSARERGRQHGEQARERVARSIDIYRPAFESGPKLHWEQVIERAKGFAAQIEAVDPGLLEEMHGIAEGAGFLPEEIVAINCRTELLYGRGAPAAAAHECTTIAVGPNASRDKTTILAKNWDWKAACQESVIILQARQADGPDFVMVVEAGMIGRDGFNEHGIAVCGNLLRSTLDGSRPGVPVPLIRRRVLNSRRLDDALGAIMKAERAASTNYIVAHESGVIINFEASPEQTYPLYPEAGLLTHSNHFTATAALVQAIGCDVGPDSLYRIQRARDLLEPKLGDITVEDVQNALRDHAGYPRSVCRHSENGRDGSASIASIVIDLGAKTMHVASGPPCEHPYQTVGLPGSQGMGESDAHSQYAHVAAG